MLPAFGCRGEARQGLAAHHGSGPDRQMGHAGPSCRLFALALLIRKGSELEKVHKTLKIESHVCVCARVRVCFQPNMEGIFVPNCFR